MRQRNSKRRQPTVPTRPLQQPKTPLRIERLGHDGRGIASCDGKITFVEGALVGELHQVRITESRRNYQGGVSVRLEADASEDRVAPICPHYGRCGGCQLQHLAVARQRQHKQQTLCDQLQRAGVALDGVEVLPMLAAASTGYRRRARLSVSPGKPLAMGFRAIGGDTLIAIEQCPVLDPALQPLLPALQALVQRFRPRTLGHLELTATDGHPLCLVRLTARLNAEETQLLSAFRDAEILLQQPGSTEVTDLQGVPVNWRGRYQPTQEPLTLEYGVQDFIQVNRDANELLIQEALRLMAPRSDQVWLDLFCGIGNFSLPMADQVAKVIGVEAIAAMVEQARANANANNVHNCEFIAADLQQRGPLLALPKRVDGVLLDPPRSGAKEVIPGIARLAPERIVYVSCDPATLARDASLLIAHGYALRTLRAVDMFPHTMHIESVALFTQTRSSTTG